MRAFKSRYAVIAKQLRRNDDIDDKRCYRFRSIT